jgi:photosystem II stability/assembly factor-like uncharacterized protein
MGFNSLSFLDANNGYATGSHGYVAKTTDGGMNWNMDLLDPGANFLSIHFPNPSTGYVAGVNNQVYKTDDGGMNWKKINVSPSGHFYGVRFLDSQTGFLVGAGGVILKTQNGGASWNNESLISEPTARTVLFTRNSSAIIGLDNGQIFQKDIANIPLHIKTSPTQFRSKPLKSLHHGNFWFQKNGAIQSLWNVSGKKAL